MELHFKRLDDSIDCSKFDCGEDPLNRFLTARAITEMLQRLSVTTIALDNDVVAGFYTISPTQIERKSLSSREGRGVPYDLVPGVRIGRLAINKSHRSMGIGKMLLKHALQKCLRMSDEFGGRVVVVDAKNAKAASFYMRYGFKPIRDDPLILILKMSVILKSLA